MFASKESWLGRAGQLRVYETWRTKPESAQAQSDSLEAVGLSAPLVTSLQNRAPLIQQCYDVEEDDQGAEAMVEDEDHIQSGPPPL
ncbi:hypothetical protein CT0861_08538 [Colletotrichum tofieldiae]|uniref:Uncharacterized protein n=1 Tax=Colletotrichum tofieldiae TaxID=708197 RepID=A0A166UZB6_9PEZI|nr:hypothetical protein CT0861_08538 [Colletotrichum tofieldiae]